MNSLAVTFGVIYIRAGHQMEKQLPSILSTRTHDRYTVLTLPKSIETSKISPNLV